jgi:hypothetical protein
MLRDKTMKLKLVDNQRILPWIHGNLKISDNKRYLCHEDGTPFSAWRYRLFIIQ